MEKKYIRSGKYLKFVRLELSRKLGVKVNQQNLADRLNISKSYLSALEAGYKSPSFNVRHSYYWLCDQFGIDYDTEKINNREGEKGWI